MRDLIDGADYLATEIGVMLHLCEHIDKLDDADLSAALPALHAMMHTRLDALNQTINALARAAPN